MKPHRNDRAYLSGPPSKPQQPRQSTIDTFFRPHLARSNQAPSTAKGQSSTAPRPAASTPAAGRAQTPSSSRFAVVIAPSPGLRASHYAEHDELDDDEVAPANLISDLSPQFRRLAAQAAKPVSLSNHSIVYGDSVDEPDELAQPRAKLQSRTQQKPPPKKRGRPKGYRPSLAKKVEQIQTKAAPLSTRVAKEGARPQRTDKGISYYTGPPKRKGRPPKLPAATPREIYDSLKPEFIRFICEWEGCPAQLHNLETLERHIRVVHVKPTAALEGPVSCRWGKCPLPLDDSSVKTFGTSEELQRHVDEVHIPVQRWFVGDGPKIPISGEAAGRSGDGDGGNDALPAYLLDKDGNQVTPSIREQKEEDVQTYRDRRRRLKTLLMEWNSNAPEEGEGYDLNAGDADEDRLYG